MELIWTACKNGTIHEDAHLHRMMQYTPGMFQIVCKNGHLDAAKWLLGKGVYIDSYSPQWETSFNLTCKFGQLHVAKWLHANGANIHFADRHEKTPLFNACMLGHLETVQWLVSIGADIHHANIKGETPMYIACYFNHLHVAKWLWSVGVDVRRRYNTIHNGANTTIMYAACLQGHLDVVKWVHSLGGVDDMHLQTTMNGNTSLHIACIYNHLDVVKWLIAHGASVHLKNRTGDSPLISACMHNHLKIVQWLWPLDQTEYSGRTPLTQALTFTGCGELCMWLLLNGAISDMTGNVCPTRFAETHPNERTILSVVKSTLRYRDETLYMLFMAVGSKLGDATSTVFDYLGSIRGRQLRIARQITLYANSRSL